MLRATGNTGMAVLADGTLSAPSLTFATDTDTGRYLIGAGNMADVVGGVKILDISADGLIVSTTKRLALGAITNYIASPDGSYNKLIFVTSDIEQARISSTGLAVIPGVTANSGTAIPAGGTTGAGLKVSSTANFGVFFGSGVPTLSAAQGSLYLRSDGSSTTTRAYINTDGATTWTAVSTVA